MDYKETAKNIIENIGGEDNVSYLYHCATRLRFNLKDSSKANTDAVKKIPGVMGAVEKGGQYQVIVGSDVGSVFREINNQYDLNTEGGSGNDSQGTDEEKSFLNTLIDTLTGIFTPILPAITASGMMKAVLSLLVVFKLVDNQSMNYQIINFMADSAFYFLPFLLAVSAANKFKTNQYLALMIAGIYQHPNFVAMVQQANESGGSINLFGLPIGTVGYSSTVIPIILSILLLSYVEPIADRVSHKSVKFFTKPLISITVVGILSLVIIGPIGHYISDLISNAIVSIENIAPWLVPTIIGAIFPLLVSTGTHYGIIPIGINNRLTNGYDTFVYPANLASNISQGVAAMAVGLKTKNTEVKSLAFSSGLTAVLGITEPVLFGINLRFKTPLYAAMVGGGVGGLFMGIFGVRNFSGGSPGLLTLPSYIGEDTLRHFYLAIAGAAIAAAVTFIVTMIIYKDEEAAEEIQEVAENIDEDTTTETNAAVATASVEIVSPMNGHLRQLSDVPDEVFSQGILGQGVAIIPTDDTVYAPFNGTVTALFDSKHAIGLTSDDGVELLIHVGIDTVQMNGEGFAYAVERDQKITVGQPLLTFNIEKIKDHGYSIITPVVVTNSNDLNDILTVSSKQIAVGEDIIKIIN